MYHSKEERRFYSSRTPTARLLLTQSVSGADRGCYGETKGLIAPKIPTSGDKVN